MHGSERTIAITGASRGRGAEIARAMHERGHRREPAEVLTRLPDEWAS